MVSVDDALECVLGAVARLKPARMPLTEALGLVLAEDVVASEDVPAFANSAMDGYAVVSRDTASATVQHPVVLRVNQHLPAGRWPDSMIATGCAARIMTGAPLPQGADTVIQVECTQRGDDGTVLIGEPVSPGHNVRLAADDVRRGETVLRQGALLRPAEIGLLAALGHADVLAYPRPHVAVVTTGSELVEPGRPVPRGHVRNSNRYSLSAQVAWCGASVGTWLHVPDELDPLEQALRQCSDADLIVTSGGVSVGDFDLVKDALATVGRIQFQNVAIRPGKPVVFGTVGRCPLFGLPGNPGASMVTFEVFVRPALDQLRGLGPRRGVKARLGNPVSHKPDRRTYLRARVVADNGVLAAYPVSAQGSGQISSLVQANALVAIPEGRRGLGVGEWVEAIPLWERGGGMQGSWTL